MQARAEETEMMNRLMIAAAAVALTTPLAVAGPVSYTHLTLPTSQLV